MTGTRTARSLVRTAAAACAALACLGAAGTLGTAPPSLSPTQGPPGTSIEVRHPTLHCPTPDEPTDEPTAGPTDGPTDGPTAEPTEGPSAGPTGDGGAGDGGPAAAPGGGSGGGGRGAAARPVSTEGGTAGGVGRGGAVRPVGMRWMDGTGGPWTGAGVRRAAEDGPAEVLWDGKFLKEGVTTAEAGLVMRVEVPEGARPGVHLVATRCVHSGGTTSPGARFQVVARGQGGPGSPGPSAAGRAGGRSSPDASRDPAAGGTPEPSATPGKPPPGAVARFEIPLTLASAHDFRLDPVKGLLALAAALLLALLVTAPFFLLPLVGFPSDIFNKSVEENTGQRDPLLKGLTPRAKLMLFTAVSAALLTVASADLFPEGRFSPANMVALAAAFFLAVLVTTITYGWVPRALTVRGVRATVMRVLPAALAVAVVCAVLSRVAAFKPGYVYGLIAVFEVTGAAVAARAATARAILWASVLTLAAGAASWAAWARVDRLMSGAVPGVQAEVARVADLFLGTATLTVLSTVVFGLLPLRFLDGHHLFTWNRAAWFAVFVPSAACFVYLTLIDTTEAPTAAEVVAMLLLFLGFGALSMITWLYVVLRARRAERLAR
ncbi:PT domain-containing protein [Sphaerisporangium sp. B11E5]|uniref:PT domain-containing protein n=1 Tax=Sphaerisporangium sp. B11E5 TaxID=3153563 RepID=UPI00325DA773